MNFRIVHNNINVFDLNRSIEFYNKALNMREVRRKVAQDESFIIVFLEDGTSGRQLELTWLRDREKPYDLGDNEIHLAVRCDNFEGARKLHEKMGCVCFENLSMGIYFISDPDGYWIEIIPERSTSNSVNPNQ